MRKLASFDDPRIADALDGVLSGADIPTVVRPDDDGQRAIWVVSEQDVPKAQRLLHGFVAGTTTPVSTTRPLPPEAPAPASQAPRVVVIKKTWRQRAAEAPVSTGLLLASIAVTLYTGLGSEREHVSAFTIASLPKPEDLGWTRYGDLRAGQIWRLFTPILLHFHPFHLLFNLFWLNDLGGPTERFQGSWRYAGFLAFCAAISNLAQLQFGFSPNFGGLSGIIYALVGYLWLRGRADPRSGINMPRGLVIFFVIWLILGFTGLLTGVVGGGAIANYCHLGGFAAGALYGYIAALISTGRLRH
jgi:GlpG protein